jgi:hypothetical protein
MKRYEDAFRAVGISFFKSRPAREFMIQMGKDSSIVLAVPSIERFERLIEEVNSRYEKHKAAGRKPFQ